MTARLFKWGNGRAVRIPQSVAERLNLKEGDLLDVEAVIEGRLELRLGKDLPTLAQLVAQITSANRYSEVPSGVDVGNEKIES